MQGFSSEFITCAVILEGSDLNAAFFLPSQLFRNMLRKYLLQRLLPGELQSAYQYGQMLLRHAEKHNENNDLSTRPELMELVCISICN